jgi:hypothetical protein
VSTEARYLDREHLLTYTTDLVYVRPESITEDERNENVSAVPDVKLKRWMSGQFLG